MLKKSLKVVLAIAAIIMILFSCELSPGAGQPADPVSISWEDYSASQVREYDGLYYVEGDIAFESLDNVRAFFDNNYGVPGSKSTVNLNGSSNDVWSSTNKLNLTFAISNTFDTNKAFAIRTMLRACAAWENVANIDFKYLPGQDTNATTSNSNIVFFVRPSTTAEEADPNKPWSRAFFPSTSKSGRQLVVYNVCYTQPEADIDSLMTHELGHVLGLRHEAIWDSTGKQIRETSNPAKLLTAQDDESIMWAWTSFGWSTYSGDMFISPLDITGITSLYTKSPVRYTAVLEKSTADEVVVNGLTHAEIVDRYNRLLNEGYKFHTLRSHFTNNEQRFSAVFRKSSAQETWVAGWAYSDFNTEYNTRMNQGWRLHIFDPYVAGNQILYTAVWRKLSNAERWVAGWAYSDFATEYNRLRGLGYSLKSFDNFVFDGKILYNALFVNTNESESWIAGWSVADYQTKYTSMYNAGWRLRSLDTFYFNGQRHYSALWKKSTASEKWYGTYTYNDLMDRYDSLLASGYRIKSISVFE